MGGGGRVLIFGVKSCIAVQLCKYICMYSRCTKAAPQGITRLHPFGENSLSSSRCQNGGRWSRKTDIKLEPNLWRMFRTFQSLPTPLFVLAFCAMVEMAEWRAAPSVRCNATLPTTTIGFLAWFRTCDRWNKRQEKKIHSYLGYWNKLTFDF